MVKALLSALNSSPTHDVEAPPLVLKVASLAFLALHLGRRVVALASANALFKVVVVVAVEAFVAVNRLAVVDVTVVAVVLAIDPGMLFCQRAWTRRKEVVLRRRRARSKEAQQQGNKACLDNRDTSTRTSHNNKQILQRLCEGQVNMHRRD